MTARTALPANPFPVPERALPALTRLEEYQIERVLAQSSFAVIYRAYDHALKLHVAIKEYLPDALAQRSTDAQVLPRSRGHAERFELGRQAFIGEAQTLARCDHPALLRIMRVLQRHGTVYRVMRYCPGPTLLAQRRDVAEAPDVATLRLWLDQLLGALQALHDEGFVHGAVAPGNILLAPGDRPVLLDFDAVRAALISDCTQSMMAALEPCFAPIEQRQPAAHMPLGPWTDLYSLAASLHFCVSGQLPTPVARDAPAGFEPLSTLWQRLGLAGGQDAAPLLDALDACLAGLPEYRPQSVAQFRALLLPGALPHAAPAASRPAPDTAAVQEAPMRPSAAHTAPLLPTLPMAIDTSTTAPATGPSPPFDEPVAQDSVAALQPLVDDFAAAHEVPSVNAATRQPRRHRRYVGGVLAALAIAGVTLWWASMGDAPSSNRADEPPAAAIELPAAQESSPPGGDVLTLPPPAAGRPEPEPAPAPAQAQAQAPPALPPQVPQTIAAPAAQPAAQPPAKPAAPSPSRAKPKAANSPAPALTSPREVCGKRTQFALYQCMQTQCAKATWSQHEQCRRLRQSDAVD